MASLRLIGLCLAGAGLLGVACSGKAVVDEPSDGGSSSSSSSSSTSSSGSTGSTTGSTTGTSSPDCAALTQELQQLTALATACDSCVDEPECAYLSGQQLTDGCGCPIPVNQDNSSAVQAAVAAYSAWTAAGCGPSPCGPPCAVSNNPSCNGGPDPSCNGVCSAF